VLCVDELPLENADNDANLDHETSPDDAAYVIYTSGSTGTPKGVVGPHCGVVNRFAWMWRTYPFAPGEVSCQKTSLSFVDSVWEVFGALLQGIPTAIVPDTIVREPQLLMRYLAERQVTRLVLVPSLLKALLDQCPDLTQQLACLKFCISSGEALSATLAEQFRKTLPGCKLINLYGSSEVAGDVARYEANDQPPEAGIPVGRPIHNTQIYLLDSHLEPVPVGVRGELYIGGDNLARGYLHRPELTAEKFIANPFNGKKRSRLYRTDDMARYRADGSVEFLGRVDNQVKIRGCRIELSEIDATLNRHPAVRECVVVASTQSQDESANPKPVPSTYSGQALSEVEGSKIENPKLREFLVAYVVPANSLPSAGELRAFLKRKLPEFMVPSSFVVLDAIPLLPNGKVDWGALPPAQEHRCAADRIRTEPRTEIEALVAQVWRETLNLDLLGVNDNFFELGGHSLLAAQVAAKLRAAIGHEVCIRDLFEAPTVAGLAEIVEQRLRAEPAAGLPPITATPRRRFLPLSPSQERLFSFAQLFGGGDFLNMPYAYRLAGPLQAPAMRMAIKEIVQRHESLRTGFTETDDGPRQFVRRRVDVKLPLFDLSRLAPDQRDARLDQLSRDDAAQCFDLERPPLLRVKLLRLAAERHVLLVTMHHIITDQWSMAVFRKELTVLYQAFSQGLPSPLPGVPVQFLDFVAWQRQILSNGLLSRQISYWRDRLSERPACIDFRCGVKGKSATRFHSSRKPIEIDDDLFKRLKNFAGELSCTPFMVFLAALKILIYRFSRGAAQSAVNGDREYDRFLRADYVVEDIENLRQELLKTKPWDAIYAHSWGTVVAQRYAAKYGNPKDPEPKVKSLILSGPVDRHRVTTHDARTQVTIDNLRKAFAYYRSQGAANCQCQSSSFLRPVVTDFSDPQISTFGGRLGPSDNFCFLSSELADKIIEQLERVIPEIDENYGSADFVVDHFQALKDDADFQKHFAGFPIEFFAAVRYLQMAGAPEKGGLVFVADSRSRMNAALLIAHTLTAGNPGRCEAKGPLFAGAAADCEYCERFKAAKEEIRAQLGGRESRRASYVFGVYDGVARWIAVMMEEKGCFTGKDLEKFANSSVANKRFGRDQAKRIGIVAGEKICPWNPADFRHEVATLLIKGSRDAVIAGCQAEDFLINGLKDGRRVLLEFKGLGHDMSVGNLYEGSDPSIWSKRFAGLMEDFIKMSANVSKFRSDAKVKTKIQQLRASDRTRDPSIAAQCGKNS
jgi:amino acid adenylation domain-containing protein